MSLYYVIANVRGFFTDMFKFLTVSLSTETGFTLIERDGKGENKNEILEEDSSG